MIGGMAESHAYMGEGLATALVFFEDLQEIREAKHRHCILICNSPPYNFPIMECEMYAGRSTEQMANLFQEVLNFSFKINKILLCLILIYYMYFRREFSFRFYQLEKLQHY